MFITHKYARAHMFINPRADADGPAHTTHAHNASGDLYGFNTLVRSFFPKAEKNMTNKSTNEASTTTNKQSTLTLKERREVYKFCMTFI